MSIGSLISSPQSAALFAEGFIGSVLWYVIMGVLLVAAIGVFWFVRKKQE